MRIILFRKNRRPSTFITPNTDGNDNSPYLIWWNDRIAEVMAATWQPCNVGAMRLLPRDDGTFDLALAPPQNQAIQVDLLGHEHFQTVVLHALDLLTEVENSDQALIPDSVRAAAETFRQHVTVTVEE